MTAWSGTLPTILGGDIPDGDDWDQILDALHALTDSWTSYVPVWSSSGTQPVVNNGSLTGRYLRAGSLVIGSITLFCGSTTTYGTGVYSWTLPVAVSGSNNAFLSSAQLLDASAGDAGDRAGTGRHAGSNLIRVATATGRIAATTPFTWANSDDLTIGFLYEA